MQIVNPISRCSAIECAQKKATTNDTKEENWKTAKVDKFHEDKSPDELDRDPRGTEICFTTVKSC